MVVSDGEGKRDRSGGREKRGVAGSVCCRKKVDLGNKGTTINPGSVGKFQSVLGTSELPAVTLCWWLVYTLAGSK